MFPNTMYYWKTHLLARDLRDQKVSQEQVLRYFVGWIIVIMFGSSSVFTVSPAKHGLPYWIDLLAETLYTLAFVLVCFRLNRRGDGRDFLNRFVCICWPEGVKLCVIACLLALVLARYPARVIPARVVVEIIGWLLVSVFFWRVARFVKWISHPHENGAQTQA